MDLNEALNKIKIDNLKPKQEKIILKLTQKKKNIVGILPTGYGKTICYLIPHLMMGKNTIVISPLISLMEDQTKKLDNYKIPYLCFTSLHKNTLTNISKVQDGSLNAVLYFSPESLLSRQVLVKNLISKNKIGLICLDESHCLSNWKHFRTSYNDLSKLNKWTIGKSIPYLLLTATATNETIKKMMKSLAINKAIVVKGSFYKENHQIKCYSKTSLDKDIDKMIQLINNTDGKILIYCKTRNETEKISRKLNLKGIKSQFYHAQIRGSERLKIQQSYGSGELNVMTATIAFGMGIDIPNVHLIIHYGISHDIESYYQEIGRGGRDGNNTTCVVFWSNRDFMINKSFDRQIADLTERAEAHSKIWKIKEYINSHECRQQYICSYFGETINVCNKCDNCLRKMRDKNIPVMSNYLILSLILKSNNIPITKLVNKLYNHTSLRLDFKSGIKNQLDLLINLNYLLITNSETISISAKGKKWLQKYQNINEALKIISRLIEKYQIIRNMNSILAKFN